MKIRGSQLIGISVLLMVWRIVFPLWSAADLEQENAEGTEMVSVAALISNPGAYHEVVIQTVGYLGARPIPAIYLSSEDARHNVNSNAVLLNMRIPLDELTRLEGKPVLVRGRVVDRREFVDNFRVGLKDITRFVAWDH